MELGDTVKSRKVGSEHTVVVHLPSDRFRNRIQIHHNPLRDEHGRFRAMLIAQDCTTCSFGDREAGPTQELHLWLQVGTSPEDDRLDGVDLMLPSMQWVALSAATGNLEIETYFRTFGFSPIRLAGVDLQSRGGSVRFPDNERIEWTIADKGRGPARVGVRHSMFMPDDGPDVVGHRVVALVSDTVLGQPGELHVHTAALDPFLVLGERLPAVVHCMPSLKADIVWRRQSKAGEQ